MSPALPPFPLIVAPLLSAPTQSFATPPLLPPPISLSCDLLLPHRLHYLHRWCANIGRAATVTCHTASMHKHPPKRLVRSHLYINVPPRPVPCKLPCECLFQLRSLRYQFVLAWNPQIPPAAISFSQPPDPLPRALVNNLRREIYQRAKERLPPPPPQMIAP